MKTFDWLKKYNGKSVIYALYNDAEGIRYIGHSTNVYTRFKNHLYNHESEKNKAKYNWINKHKATVKIIILSDSHECWETEEMLQISKHKNLLNICLGGKNNYTSKPFEETTNEEHLLHINKTLDELSAFYKKRGKIRAFKKFTKEEIIALS